MNDLIKEHFTEPEYQIILSHGIESMCYETVEDGEDYVSRELFIALYKLHLLKDLFEKRSNETLKKLEEYSYYFGDDFGYFKSEDEDYDDDDSLDEFRDWESSIDLKKVKLTDKEIKLVKDYFDETLEGVTDFESSACGYPDYCEDQTISDEIEDSSFSLQFDTVEE